MKIEKLNSLTFDLESSTITLSSEGFNLLSYYDENKIVITDKNGRKLATTYLHDVDLKNLLKQI